MVNLTLPCVHISRIVWHALDEYNIATVLMGFLGDQIIEVRTGHNEISLKPDI